MTNITFSIRTTGLLGKPRYQAVIEQGARMIVLAEEDSIPGALVAARTRQLACTEAIQKQIDTASRRASRSKP